MLLSKSGPFAPRQQSIVGGVLPYRVARPARPYRNVLKTVPVVLLFMGVVVVALPMVILLFQQDGSVLEDLSFPDQPLIGMILFVAGTLLVFWAALVLAIRGGGTPLPFDAPRRLVISGPYAWFRNPMVVGTLLQGFAIAVYAGSLLVTAYVAALGLFWEFAIRPDDEDELQRVFGREFELYRRSVRCWLPMRRPWSRPDLTRPIAYAELNERKLRKRR